MATSREQAMEALLAALTGAATFGIVTRRLFAQEQMSSAAAGPGLALVKHHETYFRQSPSLPPRRTLTVLAVVYVDVGANINGIPDAVLNPIQDAIDAALAPDDPSSNRCTLGGLVFSAMVSGEVIAAPGDKSGKGLAVIPIELIMP